MVPEVGQLIGIDAFTAGIRPLRQLFPAQLHRLHVVIESESLVPCLVAFAKGLVNLVSELVTITDEPGARFLSLVNTHISTSMGLN
jgi:hypothetical protein